MLEVRQGRSRHGLNKHGSRWDIYSQERHRKTPCSRLKANQSAEKTNGGIKCSLKTWPAQAERAALAVTVTTEHRFPSKGLFLSAHADNEVVFGAFWHFYWQWKQRWQKMTGRRGSGYEYSEVIAMTNHENTIINKQTKKIFLHRSKCSNYLQMCVKMCFSSHFFKNYF